MEDIEIDATQFSIVVIVRADGAYLQVRGPEHGTWQASI